MSAQPYSLYRPAESGNATLAPCGWEAGPGVATEVPYRLPFHVLIDQMSASGHGAMTRIVGKIPSGAPSEYEHLRTQLRELEKLGDDWNGYGSEAPNAQAIQAASTALAILHDLGSLPSRIVASADGGAALLFFLTDGYADIECFNSGETLAGLQLPDRPPEVDDVILDFDSLRDFCDRICRSGNA